MSKAPSKKVPDLRFPEFKGEWEQRSFASLYNFESTNSYSRDMLSYETGSVKNIHYGDVHTKFKALFFMEDEKVPFVNPSIDLSQVRESQYLQEGDLVVADASEDYADIGKSIEIVSLGGMKVVAGLHTILARRKNADEMAIGFAAYLMQSEDIRLNIKRAAQGTKVLGLSSKRLGEIKMRNPHFEEQKKIAAFLSSVDRRIEGLEKRRDLLKEYKKGLMQQLFSQTLRFMDDNGKPFPDWEKTTFGSLYDFKTTNSYSRDMLNYDAGSVKNIHYGDVHTKFKALFCVEKENVPYIDPSIDLSKLKEDQYLQEGDLVIADASEDYADIGKSIEIIKLGKTKAVAGLHVLQARKKPGSEIAAGFAAYLMQSRPIRLQIMRVAQGTKVLGLSSTFLSAVKVRLPKLAEQKKIAECLSVLDQKIESVSAQVARTREFKQGLLQKMFV